MGDTSILSGWFVGPAQDRSGSCMQHWGSHWGHGLKRRQSRASSWDDDDGDSWVDLEDVDCKIAVCVSPRQSFFSRCNKTRVDDPGTDKKSVSFPPRLDEIGAKSSERVCVEGPLPEAPYRRVFGHIDERL